MLPIRKHKPKADSWVPNVRTYKFHKLDREIDVCLECERGSTEPYHHQLLFLILPATEYISHLPIPPLGSGKLL